ncbi:unnamed protein product [Penicillium nalgiovense]|nr:unnamed protein product [Penicillium nalgiovense]CAG8134068.1 unnamed protein product [Penicillium nalgiovense]CAG8139096.1 unnamed protein product [Penicillium nalgiovense]CAG8144248.1 unnamed protein product [Penicillium nalgiovense]CAG8152713.1 unnamed protein product [Penicillium nalgiovense]
MPSRMTRIRSSRPPSEIGCVMPTSGSDGRSLPRHGRESLDRPSMQCRETPRNVSTARFAAMWSRNAGRNSEKHPPRDHALKAERSVSGSPRNSLQNIPLSQREDRQGPPTSKRPRINIVRARVTTLYIHAPQPRWILDTAGDPVEAEGIGTVKLTLWEKFNQPLVLRNVYFAPRVGINLISVPKLLRGRYSVVAHPQNIFVQRRGRDGPWGPPTTRRRIC